MQGAVVILEVLFGVLTLMEQGTRVAVQLRDLIQRSRDENWTEEQAQAELDRMAAESNAAEADLIDRLRALRGAAPIGG